MRNPKLVLALVTMGSAACGSDTAPKNEARSAAPQASAVAAASSAPSAAPPSVTATATASAALAEPSATAAVSAAPLVAAEEPAAEAPTSEEFSALEKEIGVRASGEQKCSTKVLRGWFELSCGEADGLVRATKVDVLSGFDGTKAILEPFEGKTLRWVAPLPASGERAQARMWGGKLHEIFITLDHSKDGWKGQLSGKKPE